MSDCSQHKKDIAGISDMKVLAEMIADLHYETLARLLNQLTLEINEDGTNDYNSGRMTLGGLLIECGENLSSAANCMEAAWQISKRFMKDKTTLDINTNDANH